MRNQHIRDINALRSKFAEKSLLAFATYYLVHYLKLTPSPAHHRIYDILEDISVRRNKRLAMAAPRGFGKSTLITLFYIIYAICYRRERFIVILSDTARQALDILENIKKELTENERIRTDFPEVYEKNGRPKPPRWTVEQIESQNGVKVIALGSGQNIRGRRFGKDRPTLIIADDIETQENVVSEISRDKTKVWFTKSVLMAGDENTNFIFLGTLYHPLSLLGEYLSPHANHEWIKQTFKVIESGPKNPDLWAQWSEIYNFRQDWEGKTGSSAAESFYLVNRIQMNEGIKLLWPEKWSYYDLMVKREEDPLSFYCELQNEPYDPKTAIFDVEKFHYIENIWGYRDALFQKRQGWLEFYGSCDPSMGEDATRGDYTAILIAARDIEDGRLYVVEADINRRSPQETITRIVDYCRMYKPVTFFVETNTFQKLMMENLERDLVEQGINTPVMGIENRSEKKKRIHSLEPLINRGYIQFSLLHERLRDQFRFFPNGQHDDGPDALEMIVSNVVRSTPVLLSISCIQLHSARSSVVEGTPDLRGTCIPHVYGRKPKDRFVPDPEDY